MASYYSHVTVQFSPLQSGNLPQEQFTAEWLSVTMESQFSLFLGVNPPPTHTHTQKQLIHRLVVLCYSLVTVQFNSLYDNGNN